MLPLAPPPVHVEQYMPIQEEALLPASLDPLVHNLSQLAQQRRLKTQPLVAAIAGCPGVGKTHLTDRLNAKLKAQGIQSIVVRFDDWTKPADTRCSDKGAEGYFDLDQIYILKSEPFARKLGHLLFEIDNAMQIKKYLKLMQVTKSGSLNRESYTKTVEQQEYTACQIFTKAIKKCIAKDRWPKAADLNIPVIISQYPTFKSFWTNMLSNSHHADHHRERWDRVIKPLYCKKHPQEPDCT